MYGRRRKLTAEEKEANRVAKLNREQASMTCQCCARRILANTGVIAHHGYERPGDGWQTSSCYGARQLPFEVDRKVLGEVIGLLQDRLVRMIEARNEVEAETMALTASYHCGYDAQHKPKYQKVEFTRETIAEAKMWHKQPFGRGWNDYGKSFDEYKTLELNSRDNQIKSLEQHIKDQQARFNGWKQTHVWAMEAWVCVLVPQ